MALNMHDTRRLKERLLEALSDEINDMDWMVEAVANRLTPEDVFSSSTLDEFGRAWASDNGYVKQEPEA